MGRLNASKGFVIKTLFSENFDGIANQRGIQTRIVRVEGEHADHLTTSPNQTYLNRLVEKP